MPFGGRERNLAVVVVTRFAARSIVKASVGRPASSSVGVDAAQRGAHARQQLVHAERLRDVVVGARVERGDLVALGVARRQHDDRHLGPAAQAVDHLDPVDPGQPEVEHDDVGVMARRQLERVLARRRRRRPRSRVP